MTLNCSKVKFVGISRDFEILEGDNG